MMALLAVPFFVAIFLKGLNGQGSKRMALIAVCFGALMSVLSKARCVDGPYVCTHTNLNLASSVG